MGSIDTMLSNFLLPLQELADEHSRVHCRCVRTTKTNEPLFVFARACVCVDTFVDKIKPTAVPPTHTHAYRTRARILSTVPITPCSTTAA